MMPQNQQELIYVFSEEDADRLYKLSVALTNAIGEFLTSHQQLKKSCCLDEVSDAPYDFWEMGYYERLHEFKRE